VLILSDDLPFVPGRQSTIVISTVVCEGTSPNCVEVAFVDHVVPARDSKNPDGDVLFSLRRAGSPLWTVSAPDASDK
jgi:hypothetical protein